MRQNYSKTGFVAAKENADFANECGKDYYWRLRVVKKRLMILKIFDQNTKTWFSSQMTKIFGNKLKEMKEYKELLRDSNLWSNPTRLIDKRLALSVDCVKSTSLVQIYTTRALTQTDNIK